jgi:hypothetical protein
MGIKVENQALFSLSKWLHLLFSVKHSTLCIIPNYGNMFQSLRPSSGHHHRYYIHNRNSYINRYIMFMVCVLHIIPLKFLNTVHIFGVYLCVLFKNTFKCMLFIKVNVFFYI